MTAEEGAVLADTNILIHGLLPEQRPALISAVTLAELEHGIVAAALRGDAGDVRSRASLLEAARAAFGDGLPFTGSLAAEYGRIVEAAMTHGLRPRSADTMIAATALHHHLPLLTTDRRLTALSDVLEVLLVEPAN